MKCVELVNLSVLCITIKEAHDNMNFSGMVGCICSV